MFIEGFAPFLEEFLSEKLPGTRKPIDLYAPWSAEVRKATEEETKKWAPNTAILREEATERSIKGLQKIWGLPKIEKAIGDNAKENIEDAVEDGRKGTKVEAESVEDMVEEVGDVLKNPKDDIGDGDRDIEIKSNEELDEEKIAGKSSAIDRLHRLIKGILHIHPGWYNQQVTH